MGKLAAIRWREFEDFLAYIGCHFVRERGDHRIWQRAGLKRPIVIPKVDALPVFVIRNNLRLLGLSVDAYIDIQMRL